MKSGRGIPRLRVHGLNREMKELCTQVNEMADQTQQYAVQIARMEETQKKMISNLLHDVQTPLAVMLGYVEALQVDDSLSEADKQRYLGIIRDRGSKLSRLFTDFFDLAKLESDDLSLALVQINLPEKVEEIAAVFEMECLRLGLDFHADLPFEPIHVWAYPPFIERILTNLLSNAMKYGKCGGVVGVQLRIEETLAWGMYGIADRALMPVIFHIFSIDCIQAKDLEMPSFKEPG
ncbi:MAG: HAMP domain-containing histidine kinase [Paenibacillus sp.]|nr:HAMP domain-containing histidine kinase [Paenibacillus sp.]